MVIGTVLGESMVNMVKLKLSKNTQLAKLMLKLEMAAAAEVFTSFQSTTISKRYFPYSIQ